MSDFSKLADAIVNGPCGLCHQPIDKHDPDCPVIRKNPMIDLTAPKALSVEIRDDGKVVWINTEEGCVFRACQIGTLIVQDRRPNEWMANTFIGLTKLMNLYKPESDAWATLVESKRLLEHEMRLHGNYTTEQIEALNETNC